MADSSQARRLLDYVPAVPLSDGIADLVARFSALPEAHLSELASRVVVKNWQ
jgi:hypothetical protein